MALRSRYEMDARPENHRKENQEAPKAAAENRPRIQPAASGAAQELSQCRFPVRVRGPCRFVRGAAPQERETARPHSAASDSAASRRLTPRESASLHSPRGQSSAAERNLL